MNLFRINGDKTDFPNGNFEQFSIGLSEEDQSFRFDANRETRLMHYSYGLMLHNSMGTVWSARMGIWIFWSAIRSGRYVRPTAHRGEFYQPYAYWCIAPYPIAFIFFASCRSTKLWMDISCLRYFIFFYFQFFIFPLNEVNFSFISQEIR